MKLDDIKLIPLMDTLRLQKISDEVYFSEKYKNGKGDYDYCDKVDKQR